LELYEKVYVSPAFLDTEHGQLGCEFCHGGNPSDSNWQTAHRDVVKDPTYPDPSGTCGQCHEEIADIAMKSLHYTLAAFDYVVNRRVSLKAPIRNKVMAAKEMHCSQCHASCGQCHVSRPNYVHGGLLAKHVFKKSPPMDVTCASCHGGRVYGEYTGLDEKYASDVHFEEEEMTCMACHTAEEMHADPGEVPTRFFAKQRPTCLQCHPEVQAKDAANEAHRLHEQKLACQVCHAQENKNCFTCHIGTDQKGLPYYKCKQTTMLFKIGLNPLKGKDRPYDYVVLRHPPTHPQLFDFYVKNGLSRFDNLPTWKLNSPHNIRRVTKQNRTCNSCHGNQALFLKSADMAPWELSANTKIIVPDSKIPKKLTDRQE
jgi:thiosulfate/3-mercaptopyruvate sulfurtransferase